MVGSELQAAILAQVRKRIPAEKKFAVELAAVIGVGTNAAYKRIEGKTALTLEDVARLAKHFDLPWQELMQPDVLSVSGQFSGFAAPVSCLDYLKMLEQELQTLQKAGNAKISLLTVGLPDFHLFHFEELAIFQVYFWERMVWGNPAWQDKRFSFEQADKAALAVSTKRIAHLYQYIETVELWNDHILDSYLHQIAYVYESRLFEKPDDLRRLTENLHSLADHLESMAKLERRFAPGGLPSENTAPWQLYSNEIMRNNIFFLVETPGSTSFYSVMNNPHFFKSSDSRMVQYAKTRIGQHLERSLPLGRQGEKHRGLYFDRLRKQIDDAQKLAQRA